MKGNKIIITIIITIILTSTNMFFAYTEDNSHNKVEEDAYSLGYLDGKKEADKSLSDKKDLPYYLVIPEKESILDKYSYYKEDLLKDNFYWNYLEGFKDGYQSIVKNNSINNSTKESNTNYASSFGKSLGEIYGFRDFYNKINSNWNKSIPSDNEVIGMLNIEKHSNQYKLSFLSIFRESFKLGYEEGYEKGNLEPKKISLESGFSDGENIGTILGAIYGSKDYFENISNNHLRNLPKDTDIIRNYALKRDYKEYADGFLIGFKRAFEENYNKFFRQANINTHIKAESDSYDHGKNAGLIKGKLLGNKDFILKRENNWRNHKFLSSNIISEYNLLYQSTKYKDGFISGYWEGFAEGYSSTYRNLGEEEINKKTTIINIPISGGTISSLENELYMEIETGTYYRNVLVSIDEILNNPYVIDNNRYIEASKFYIIEIQNKNKTFDNSKTIDISFEFYGKSGGGIYKRINNQWIYLNSKIKDNRIITSVRPSTLEDKENIFCVLIDKENILLRDIRSHWAKDEITTLVRRDIIEGYGDGKFKPEKQISRAEFLTLLSRVYNWDLSLDSTNIKNFNDYENFFNYDKVISHGISNGYIQGYEDNTFRPNNPISYKEVEVIMGRLLKDYNFKWYNTSAKILYEKQVKSNSYKNINNKITRAEASYMLYTLNEWRY